MTGNSDGGVMKADGATGSCLCGGVRWRVRGPLRAITACHCTQCRKASGHFSAYSGAPHDAFEIEAGDSLKWYRSSPSATRGFCGTCGSVLFWQPEGAARVAISAGSIDGPTGLAIAKHIFCADKGDYYEINDAAEHLETH